MTAALDAMVKAMAAEIERQAEEKQSPAERRLNEHYGTPAGIGAGDVDLEKVARAGLEAIREPLPDVIEQGWRSGGRFGLAPNPNGGMDQIWDYSGTTERLLSPTTYDTAEPADEADRLNALETWRAMIDEILKAP